jgi:hypothetical protein
MIIVTEAALGVVIRLLKRLQMMKSFGTSTRPVSHD